MNKDYSVVVNNLSKIYRIYNRPTDRLKEALHLSKKNLHTDFFAISNISFKLPKGEILGIMGRNGAGKSTLLKMISGVLTPSAGTITVSGKVSSLLELGAGFNMEYTGIENIYFYCTLMGMTSSQINAQIQDIISFAEIGDYIYQPVKTYSSGMFARLAFSCAINVAPDILIVDEILSVGDMRFQSKCFNKFKEFKHKGVTIIYVGHDISLMRSFCDTCMWLHNGKLVDKGDPVYISSQYTEFMYLDDTSEFTHYYQSSKPVLTEANGTPGESLSNDYDSAQSSGIPLAHWGTHKGMICNAQLLNAQGESVDIVEPLETIQITFMVNCPEDLKSTEYLALAFSIKNREGTDLIVKSTYDEDIKLCGLSHFRVTFELKELLVAGDYYLVLAAEDRESAAIRYYEYIEGALYFRVFQKTTGFGLFLPETLISINEEKHRKYE